MAVLLMMVFLLTFDLVQYNTSGGEKKSNCAHLGGALMGLCMGVVIGKNYVLTTPERVLKYVSGTITIAVSAFCVVWLFINFPPKGFWESDVYCWHRQVFNTT